MANLNISQFPQTTTVTGPELIPLFQGGATKYSNASDIPLSAFKNTTLATTTQVAAVSAGLDARATANANGVNTLFSTYTASATTQAISAGLQSQINGINLTPVNNSINTLFSTYTASATTQAISAGLQSQINSINVVAGTNVTVNQNGKTWTVSSIGGGGGGNSWLPTQGTGMSITAPTTSSYLFSVNDYIGATQVAAVSAGLQSQISGINLTPINNSINTLFSTYTASSTTSAISAGLQSQINGISGANLTPINNSINTLFSTYTASSTTSAISAGLQSQINTLASATPNVTGYTPLTTTQAISAGLQSQINSFVVIGVTGVITGGNVTLSSADNGKTFAVSGSPIITVNANMPSGFGAAFAVASGTVTVTGGSNVTVTDTRTSTVPSNICSLVQVAANAYWVVGPSTLTGFGTNVTTLTDPNGVGNVTIAAPSGPFGRFILNFGANAGTRTLVFTGLIAGASGIITVTQNSTGNVTLAQPTFGAKTPNGSGIILSPLANSVSSVAYYYDGTIIYLSVSGLNWA